MKTKWLMAITILSLMGAGAAFAANSKAAINGPARVIDGDTIEIGAARIRLEGIDAAELNTEEGKRARMALRKIVGGNHIVCHLAGYKSYNREVATCFTLGGIDIGEKLIRRGWAVEDTRYTNRYAAAEREAIDQAVGRWEPPRPPKAKNWWENENLITAIFGLLTVLGALGGAIFGAERGATKQAKLARAARVVELTQKRYNVETLLATTTMRLAEQLNNSLAIKERAISGGKIVRDMIRLEELRPDPIEEYLRSCNRLLPDIALMDDKEVYNLTEVMQACATLVGSKNTNNTLQNRELAIGALLYALKFLERLKGDGGHIFVASKFKDVPEKARLIATLYDDPDILKGHKAILDWIMEAVPSPPLDTST